MLDITSAEELAHHIDLESVIAALYIGVFGRHADPGGMAYHCDLVRTHGLTLLEVANSMHESQEHKDVMGQMPSLPDHTQHGELAKIIKHVMRKGSKYNIVVDAGARGKERSNSFDLLSHFNWRGLLIEANPALHAPIRREFGGLDFTLEGCAVGLEAGTLPFYIGVNDDVSSLNKGASQVWGDIKEVVDVEVKRLPDILQAHSIPYDFDLLSVDIESLDMPVFNDLIASSPYRPSVVILEVTPELDRTSMKNIEASEIVCANYGLADVTPSNVIAVRKF